MTYSRLDDTLSVAPQITPDDLPDIVEQGFKAVICNRPDNEVPSDLSSDALRAACEAAGLTFHNIPLAPGGLTPEAVTAQANVIANAQGPILAYCASGTRSAILWAFASASQSTHPPDDIAKALDKAGYAFPGIAAQLEHFAASAP